MRPRAPPDQVASRRRGGIEKFSNRVHPENPGPKPTICVSIKPLSFSTSWKGQDPESSATVAAHTLSNEWLNKRAVSGTGGRLGAVAQPPIKAAANTAIKNLSTRTVFVPPAVARSRAIPGDDLEAKCRSRRGRWKGRKMKEKKRVTLEPVLEAEVWHLNAVQRLRLSRVYRRWARQLEVSAKILWLAEQPQPAFQSLRPLPRRRLQMN